jgi:hypothetical protein
MGLQKYDEALKATQAAADAARKINANEAIRQAELQEKSIKANIEDIQNRKQQMKH